METRTAQQFYADLRTPEAELNARLRLFVDEYRAQRARLGRALRVLDVGCGRILQLAHHVDPADDYRGADIIPPEQVDDSRYRMVDLNEESLAEAFDEPFDVIFCGEVIEHVYSPDALLDDLAACMKPDGLLILSTPNLAYWVNRLLLVAGISPLFVENSAKVKLGRRFSFLGQGNETQGHIRLFTNRAMLELLELKRFHVRGVKAVPVWPLPLDRFVCRVSNNLAPVNVYLLDKPA